MSVTVTPSTLTLRAGQKYRISATSTTGTISSWVSSNALIATVVGVTGTATATCLITALYGQQSTITITVTDSTGANTVLTLQVWNVDPSWVSEQLGFYSDDIGTLCMRSEINKWSTMKPMISTSFPLTPALVSSLKSGLTIPVNAWSTLRSWVLGLSMADLKNASLQKKWTYNQPTSTDLKRIDDFRGYCHGALPMLNLIDILPKSGKSVTTSGTCNWTISLAQAQLLGGLTPSDIMAGSGYHLGVMLINAESDNNEVTLVAANSANLDTDQSVTINIVDVATSSYYFCFFISTDAITQLNNPTDAQLNALAALANMYLIENGVIGCSISNRYSYPWVMWAFIGTGMLPSKFGSNDTYTLYSAANTRPEIITDAYGTPTKMVFNSVSNYFSIQPSWTPSGITVKWSLAIALYQDSSDFIADTYRNLVSWYDVDNYDISLCIKRDSSGVITIGFYSSANETFIDEINTGVTISQSSASPTIVVLSNYRSNGNAYMVVSLNGDEIMYDNAANTNENPPSFRFGNYGDHAAPYGLGFMYIDLRATGQIS